MTGRRAAGASGRRSAGKASWLSLETRGKLYRIATAAGAVAAFYGLVSGDELAVWLGLIATILGTGTASAFTPAVRGRGAGVDD